MRDLRSPLCLTEWYIYLYFFFFERVPHISAEVVADNRKRRADNRKRRADYRKKTKPPKIKVLRKGVSKTLLPAAPSPYKYPGMKPCKAHPAVKQTPPHKSASDRSDAGWNQPVKHVVKQPYTGTRPRGRRTARKAEQWLRT